MSITSDPERFDRQALVRELELAGGQVRGNALKSPYHEDQTASGSLYQDKESGVWRHKCQATSCGAGGDVFDLRCRRTGQIFCS